MLERLADRGAGVLRAAGPSPTDPTSPMRLVVDHARPSFAVAFEHRLARPTAKPVAARPIARAATTCRGRAWHGQRVSPVVPLRAVILDRDPGDITTIEDEGPVEEARQAWTQMKADLARLGLVTAAPPESLRTNDNGAAPEGTAPFEARRPQASVPGC